MHNYNIISNIYLNKSNRKKINIECKKCFKITSIYLSNIDKIKNCGRCSRKKKYYFNLNIFDNIDNSEKAYWIGFLYGDGSVLKYNLKLELSNKDKDHLHKFKNFINYNGPIKNSRKDCSFIELNSWLFIQKLIKNNIVPCKSNKNIYPKIDSIFLSDFYRGILDSDGWITYHKSTKQYEYGFSSNNLEFLQEIQSYFSHHIETKVGALNHRKQNNGSCYQLIIGGNNNFKKISNILYNNIDIYLIRKYNLMLRAIEDINQRIDKRYKLN